ncbi:MAG: DUF547 domain-containing protein [Salibacteraceae bacterium]
MKRLILSFIVLSLCSQMVLAQNNSAIAISQDMMTSLKMNQPIGDLESELALISFASLTSELNSDLKKQAFWANVYIVYSQKLLQEYGECEKSCRNKKVITIGNRVFSLNDILYKILLHSKDKITGGKRLIVPKWEKQLRVGYPDGRVLLAIDSHEKIVNAVTYYEPASMDTTLSEVALVFINAFIYYDVDKNEVYLPLWLKKFKREFGHKSGIITGLKNAEIIPENSTNTQIIYSDKIATLK